MPRHPSTAALQRLVVAQKNHASASAAALRTAALLRSSIAGAVQAGVSKAEIARTLGCSTTRVHQHLAAAAADKVKA